VEDQPNEPGDLTAEDAPAGVPQGKAARHKHQVLRHQLVKPADSQGDSQGDDESVGEEVADASVDETEAVEAQEESSEVAESDEPDEADEAVVDDESGEDDEAAAEDGDRPTVPHRPVGRKLIIAGIAAGALVVGATAFAGAAVQPYLADRALVHNKFEVAQTAAAAVTALWTYTPDDMEKLPDRSQKYLAKQFASEYREEIDRIAAGNKQAQITNKTKVMGAAVESIGPADAVAIVYTNSVATSPLSKNIPALRYQSYRLTLTRQGGDWLIDHMTALTQLDLTPRL
jgi:Mce-associated membrane protein